MDQALGAVISSTEMTCLNAMRGTFTYSGSATLCRVQHSPAWRGAQTPYFVKKSFTPVTLPSAS